MKIGFQLVFYIILLNVCSALLYDLAVPGTGDTTALTSQNTTQLAEQYKEDFNATTVLKDPTIIDRLLTFTGYIWAGVNVLWNVISTVVYGFPNLLNRIGDNIPDPAAHDAFSLISNVLYIAFSVIIFLWIFQLVTGREVED